MATTTTINALPIPTLTPDAQNIETATHPFLDALDSRLVSRFTSVSVRNTSITSPTEGQLAAVTETDELYKHSGTAWLTAASRFKWKSHKVPLQAKSQDTSYVHDDELFVPLEQLSTYYWQAYISYFSPAGAHLKMQWSIPPGASGRMHAQYIDANTATALILGSMDIVSVLNGYSTNTQAYIFHLHGHLTTSGTAGDLQLTWGQTNSSAGQTFICSGSWMEVRKIG